MELNGSEELMKNRQPKRVSQNPGSYQFAGMSLEELRTRMENCKLKLHPEKTRIVYYRSDNNTERHEHESFDFLGYTFQTRSVRSKSGKPFNTFTPAVSKAATKEFRDKMKEFRRQGSLWTPEKLARRINPVIRGWANNFTQFNPSEAKKKALNHVNLMLVWWAKRK